MFSDFILEGVRFAQRCLCFSKRSGIWTRSCYNTV